MVDLPAASSPIINNLVSLLPPFNFIFCEIKLYLKKKHGWNRIPSLESFPFVYYNRPSQSTF